LKPTSEESNGKRIKKEVTEGILEQSTVRTKREKITERNMQLHIHNEYTRWCDNEVFIVCRPSY